MKSIVAVAVIAALFGLGYLAYQEESKNEATRLKKENQELRDKVDKLGQAEKAAAIKGAETTVLAQRLENQLGQAMAMLLVGKNPEEAKAIRAMFDEADEAVEADVVIRNKNDVEKKEKKDE